MARTVLWQQLGSYPAGTDRGLFATLWPLGGASGAAATVVNNTMNVSLPPGSVAVPLQAGQNVALCRWDAAEVVTLTAAPPSGQSRIDLIVAQVRDNAIDGGPNNDFIFTAIAGTPAATGPVAPVAPPNALGVYTVPVAGAAANLNASVLSRVAPSLVPLSHPYTARIYRNAALNANGGGLTVPYDSISFDPNNNAVLGANAGYRCPVTGKYLVSSRSAMSGITSNTRMFQSIMVNAPNVVSRGPDLSAASGFTLSASITDIVQTNAGDVIQIQSFSSASTGMEVGPLTNWASFTLLTSP